MTKETLEKLAAECAENTSELFTPNAYYGHAYAIKKYCGISQEFPLPGIYPHGLSIIDKAWAAELKHPIPFLLLKSELQSDVYSKYSDKPSWIIGAPNYYAIKLIEDEIKEIQSNAEGTLVLPVHSTHHLTNNYDFSEFAEYLKNLPEKFNPITICLGWRDIQLKMHERYLAEGFECTTAGHMYHKDFFIRLLKIIASHKFAIANDIGTSAFYCAAMNLHVKLYRQSINTNPARSDQPSHLIQEAQFNQYLPIVEKFIDTCKDPDAQIAKQQKKIAKSILGFDYIKDPNELCSLFESLWKKNQMKAFIKKPDFIAEGSFGEIIENISKKVESHPRKNPGRVKIDGLPFNFADLHSFYYQAIQIFGADLYGFHVDNDCPVIFDCGAHIGLASLYFANKYPNSQIYAFEADPAIAEMLADNIESFKLKNVTVYPKAVWINEEGVNFTQSGDDSGFINKEELKGLGKVPSISLKDILEIQHVDLLKMDIEGAEYQVINDCRQVLSNVKNIIIEVHKFRKQNGSLGNLLKTLEKNNFEYTFGDLHSADWIETQIKPPFNAVKSDKYIITIFAWQKSGKQGTYRKEFGSSVDSQNELIERCIQHLNKNDNDKAFKLINYAIEKHPDIPALNYGKAIVFARIGKKQKAMEVLKDLLEKQPDHKNAQIVLEALKQE
jgi:FkbM family methyltransferase